VLFNSWEFLWFFPVVTFLYFELPHRFRWMLLLGASYFFYMSWKPAYLLLILASTLVDYVCALEMGKAHTSGRRRLLLLVSLGTNLGLLFAFKYLNFFAWTVGWFLDPAAAATAGPVLDVLLPVGISFYTFQTLSYTIDVYRGDRAPEPRLGIFALYVSFFPQLVAGPIERSTQLLPQFDRVVTFDAGRVTEGLRRMLLGMFKKVVVADTLAAVVDPIYSQPGEFGGPALVLATLLFAVQILCDFSGYSDIAIGAAKVLGFDLMENFRKPYGARSLREFWGRWHISLSTWFRDYCYIPLGGNRLGALRGALAVLIVFLLSGLWHGASWTFVVWGALHGSWLLVERVATGPRSVLTRTLGLDRVPRLRSAVGIGVTCGIVCLGWIFFRSDSLADAWYVVTHLGTGWSRLADATQPLPAPFDTPAPLLICVVVVALWKAMEVLQARAETTASRVGTIPHWRVGVDYGLLLCTLVFFEMGAQSFIYFQF
jgi:D-alanyl-lipoteichoic acid acyltransferase DltB (MBOAT superfamily)